MTTAIQRRIAALLTCLAASLPAAATTYSVDFTDMWFNANESGWGVNVIQQSDMIFATLFVYGADNTPRWYVTGAGLQGSGGSTFSGNLYSTTGPYFAGSFNPAAVGNAVVGSMTLSFSGPYNGTILRLWHRTIHRTRGSMDRAGPSPRPSPRGEGELRYCTSFTPPNWPP